MADKLEVKKDEDVVDERIVEGTLIAPVRVDRSAQLERNCRLLANRASA